MKSIVGQMIDNIKINNDVNLFEFGQQKRDFIFVKDVVMCNLLAGLSTTSNIYNCGYGESIDFNKIFNIITSNLITTSKINYIKNIYNFFQNETLADIKYTNNNLLFYPSYDIEKGIKDYISNII
jgi:ADP-L-glycero-D-manno-heptose 6-epimerase